MNIKEHIKTSKVSPDTTSAREQLFLSHSLLFCIHNEKQNKKESENKIMTYCYTTLNKPLRQTEKQRESSLIAERKFLKRNPLTEKRYDIKVNSEFSQNVMMNRYMMKTANFNTLNSIPDYANSMSEVILKHKRAA